MKANIGRQEQIPSISIATSHPPIVVAMSVLEDAGVLADGQIAAKNAAGEVVAHTLVENVAMTGAIDGANKAYSATLAPAPVLRGTVVVANNNVAAQELIDDGNGNLVGDGDGSVNYETGEVSATFTTAPAAGKTVLVSHRTRPIGVVTQECDTAEDDTARVLKHGAVNRDVLIRGAIAADGTDVAALEAIGVFAV